MHSHLVVEVAELAVPQTPEVGVVEEVARSAV
jgi:hypothetical protein